MHGQFKKAVRLAGYPCRGLIPTPPASFSFYLPGEDLIPGQGLSSALCLQLLPPLPQSPATHDTLNL